MPVDVAGMIKCDLCVVTIMYVCRLNGGLNFDGNSSSLNFYQLF